MARGGRGAAAAACGAAAWNSRGAATKCSCAAGFGNSGMGCGASACGGAGRGASACGSALTKFGAGAVGVVLHRAQIVLDH